MNFITHFKKLSGFLVCGCVLLFSVGCGSSSLTSEKTSTSTTSESTISTSTSEPVKTENVDFTNLSTASGSFVFESNKLVSTSQNSLAYSTKYCFEEGNIGIDIRNIDFSNDNGLIFGLTTHAKSFWEENVSYYFFFISRNKSSYLGKVDNGTWACLSDVPLSLEQLGSDYELKVVRYHSEECDVIECYVDNVLMNKFHDYSPLSGSGMGVRAGNANIEYKDMYVSNEIGQKEQEMENYYLSNGDFTFENNTYVSKLNNSIITHKTKTFEYGSLSTSIQSLYPGDNGLIFGLNDNNKKSFWENDVSYYFFFVSTNGTAYLGKVMNNSWRELGVVSIPNYNIENSYSLKVTRDAVSILCYINDQLLLNCVDSTPLSGNKIGLRAGSQGTTFTDLLVQESGSYDYKEPDNFDTTSGKMMQFEKTIKSIDDNSLIVSKDGLAKGTIKVHMCPGSMTNNGIVFKLSAPNESSKYYERETGLSYYFFHISSNGAARLLRFEDESVKIVSEFGLSAGWSGSKESLLTVIINGNNIKCYVDDACYVNYDETNPLTGSLYGLRASAKGVLFSNLEITNSTEAIHADAVLFGHSHCQFYETIHEDLASIGAIANMGVGGSIITNWENRINHITSYNAKYIFVWLGSNDLGTGMTAGEVAIKLEALVEKIHASAPLSKIIVFTEFYQPESYRATEAYHTHIRNLNDAILNRFPEYTTGLDLFDVPLKDGVLDLTMFRDIYHLKAEAYKEVTRRILNLISTIEK